MTQTFGAQHSQNVTTDAAMAAHRARYPFNGGRGAAYANGKPIDWPKCDLCGEVMRQVDLELYVASFYCPHDTFTLSFPSCRYSDRYCAWDRVFMDPFEKW